MVPPWLHSFSNTHLAGLCPHTLVGVALGLTDSTTMVLYSTTGLNWCLDLKKWKKKTLISIHLFYFSRKRT